MAWIFTALFGRPCGVTIQRPADLASALLWMHASLKSERLVAGATLLPKQNLPINGHHQHRCVPRGKKIKSTPLDADRILYLVHMLDMLLPDVQATIVEMTIQYKMRRLNRLRARGAYVWTLP